eukprot:12932935-Prorocentrum_lima.AAC.1
MRPNLFCILVWRRPVRLLSAGLSRLAAAPAKAQQTGCHEKGWNNKTSGTRPSRGSQTQAHKQKQQA